ncbi:MAG: DUF3050 domain-containing protein [Halobacteriovoraceae bacterium]|nr:DUF3050 domain-containing protein [Halobacteriovoraceae bacterium]
MELFFDKQIETKINNLSIHRLSKYLTSIENLRIFMEIHVFAVYDFMSLLKSLQREITCVNIPWAPSKYSKNSVRFINEIVVGEESDLDLDGNFNDHFTMYLEAMEEIGANTTEIKNFIEKKDLAIIKDEVIRDFLLFNFDIALTKPPYIIASVFLFGREDIIPKIFSPIVEILRKNSLHCPKLLYYLDRHIELDGNQHSVLAKALLEELCEGKSTKIIQAKEFALSALSLREKLWDFTIEKFK